MTHETSTANTNEEM